jgi:hypothetical protein
VHHRLRLLTFPMRAGTAAPFRSDTRPPSFRCDPFARDVALDPGRATAPGAEIATQSVRAVLDANHWKFLDGACATQAGIEGIAGLELKLIEGDQEDPPAFADDLSAGRGRQLAAMIECPPHCVTSSDRACSAPTAMPGDQPFQA